MTKKEKEAQELKDKKAKAIKERQKRMKELDKEIEEMKEMVRKEHSIKRRNTITSFYEMIPEEQHDRDEMPSCFNDDVSFNENQVEKEHERLSRVEWRAQF